VTWDAFFSAEVGASAALAGLLFVGISINLQRILALPTITNRALQALLILLGMLGIESLLLVPGQPSGDQGAEVLAVAVGLWAFLNAVELRNWRQVLDPQRRTLRVHTVQIQLPCLLATLGGAFLLAANSWALYWIVIATLTSFLIAIIEVWVITVEILR
jgi:hypothetical protein